MLPILSAEQTRSAEQWTIENEPVTVIALMERAARACTDRLVQLAGKEARFVCLCGAGNNGGDGLAISRLLKAAGCDAHVILLKHRDGMSPEAEMNLRRAREAGVNILELEGGSILPLIAGNEVVVDAVLGIGLDRPVAGWLKEIFTSVNALPNQVVSIDMPSGFSAEDNSANDSKAIIAADHVLTFEAPKLAMLLPESGAFIGQWHVLPIGLDRGHILSLRSPFALAEAGDMAALMPERKRFSHKGSFGHAVLLAGSHGKMGAALIAAKACSRSGVGLVTAHLPAGSEPIFHSALPEAMVVGDNSADHLQELPNAEGFSAIGIGPGIGTAEGTARLLKLLIQGARVPLVMDADAINLLASNKTWLAFLPPRSILTPHPKEFDRLAEPSTFAYERLMKAKAFAVRFSVVLVLKGAYTAICSPDGRVFFNPTGNPGMAKGGSGDALTGIITGLCAQGLDALSAAVLGVYAHGLAGDMAANELGMDGMMVTDLIDRLPLTWKRIRASA